MKRRARLMIPGLLLLVCALGACGGGEGTVEINSTPPAALRQLHHPLVHAVWPGQGLRSADRPPASIQGRLHCFLECSWRRYQPRLRGGRCWVRMLLR